MGYQIRVLYTVGLAALLSLSVGCSETKFHTASSGTLLAARLAASEAPVQIAQVCKDGLANLGFTLDHGSIYKMTSTGACASDQVGYIEQIQTIDVSATNACARFENAQLSQDFSDITQHSSAPHCATYGRCESGPPRDVMRGTMLWIAKCEGQVSAFHDFLEALRGVGQVGKMRGDLGALFPQVTTRNGYTIPQISVYSDGAIGSVDDLVREAAQITAPCPANDHIVEIASVCSVGCYRPDQVLLTSARGEYTAIADAKAARLPKIAVLTASSSANQPRLTDALVGNYLASLKDEAETLVTFTTDSGLSVVVTRNHPLVDGEGVMREASDLKIDDALLSAQGRTEKIVAREERAYFGKVYNVSPLSPAPEDNLVVAQGLVSGSHNYQVGLHRLINHQVLRARLAQGF